MKKVVMTAVIYYCFFMTVYSDSIRSFSNEQDWLKYIESNTPSDYSEMRSLSREEARKQLKTEEDVKKHMEKWGRRGRFFIPLKVIDETGAVVPSINVDVSKSIGGFFKTSYDYVRAKNQHGFLVIEVKGCETVGVRLSSQNSYPTWKQRYYYLNIPSDYYIRKGDTIIGLPIPVGFRNMGPLLNLQKLERIKFQLNKKNGTSNIFSLKTFRIENELKQTSEPYFTILYKKDINGNILQKQYPSITYDFLIDSHGNYTRRIQTRNSPLPYVGFEQVEFVMVSKNPEDGIILYDDKVIPVIPTAPVAPADGYKKGFLMPFSPTQTQYHFFFKFHGRYGKGVISYDRHGNHTIDELFINNEKDPDKKRNLWTKEETCL
ncbi:MAG: hypothetical protein J5806_12900 [Lentisphaeria bacterium]|nr:hypothetical protein [Lentisphaeria bacterium]